MGISLIGRSGEESVLQKRTSQMPEGIRYV